MLVAAALLLAPTTRAEAAGGAGLQAGAGENPQDAPAPQVTAAAGGQPAGVQPTAAPPYSLERIQASLARAPQPVLRMPRPPDFSITVEGQLPRIEDFITNQSLRMGPSLPAAVTHQEFLSMVTPREAQPYQAFSPGELAVVSATSLAFAYAASTLPGLVKQAWRERRMAEARKEVAAVLAELARQERERAAPPPSDGTTDPPSAGPPP